MSEPIDDLRILLSHCPTFQAWVGASNDAEAALRIHLETAAHGSTRPFAVVTAGEDRDEPIAGGGRLYTVRNGSLGILFESTVGSAFYDAGTYVVDDPGGAIAEITEKVAAIRREMAQLAGTAGMLFLRGVRQAQGAAHSTPDEYPGEAPFAQVELECDFGLTGG